MKPTILLVDNECRDPKLKPLIDFLDRNYRLLPPQRTIGGARDYFKYDDHSIDCVILDIHLGPSGPEAGIELLNTMRETDPYLPIGMITQYDKSSVAFKSGKNLATFYCPKPKRADFDSFNKKLKEEIDNSIKKVQFLYDRDLMKKVNEDLSLTYDIEELSKLGTLAFHYWEDEIIIETIENIPGEHLEILDVCCGTGRYELLIKHHCEKPFKMTAIDFSGRMLRIAEDKLVNEEVFPEARWERLIELKRGFAEKLPFEDNKFDFVICGFGVPSYTKFNLSIPEVNRVLRKYGKAIFTVYNKNAFYNQIADYFSSNLEISPMASWVKFESFGCRDKQGIYKLVPQGKEEKSFTIQPFSKEEFRDILNRFGFRVEKMRTFPFLYSVTPINLIRKDEDDPLFKPRYLREYKLPDVKNLIRILEESIPADWLVNRPEIKSYKQEKKEEIEKAYENADKRLKNFPFSWKYYQLDKHHAEKIGDGGFYITAIVEKVRNIEKVNIYEAKENL